MMRGVFGVIVAAVLCACGTGSMGAPGTPGPTGPMGSAASVRFRLIVASQTSTQAEGLNRTAFANCPEGSRVIAGSCICSPAPDVHIAASATLTLATFGTSAGLAGAHMCTCAPPSSVTEWIATAQATCVDGSGATVE